MSHHCTIQVTQKIEISAKPVSVIELTTDKGNKSLCMYMYSVLVNAKLCTDVSYMYKLKTSPKLNYVYFNLQHVAF